jgi:hypothetical protein
MDKQEYIIEGDQRPDWLMYPQSFVRIVEQGLVNLTPWHIMPTTDALSEYRKLAERYPARTLFPFAFRQDTDDIACWERDRGAAVFVIHNFAAPGFENEESFDTVWDWFRSAIEEMIAWD